MLTYALIAATALLVWLVYRHLSGKRAPILIGLLVVLMLGGAFVWVGERRAEARYTAAASEMLGRSDVEVTCQSLSAALLDVMGFGGYVPYKADGSLPTEAHLMWETCRDLRKWERDPQGANLDGIVALHILTHETMHLSGEYVEAAAECFAIQKDAAMAALLGADTATGRAHAARYFDEVYPRMREDYRSAECAASKAMDLAPETAQWPTG